LKFFNSFIAIIYLFTTFIMALTNICDDPIQLSKLICKRIPDHSLVPHYIDPNSFFSKFTRQTQRMTRDTLIKKTMDNLNRLPDQKLQQVLDFAELLLSKIDDQLITQGIQKLAKDSKVYKFLEEEDDLYSVQDLKEKYK